MPPTAQDLVDAAGGAANVRIWETLFAPVGPNIEVLRAQIAELKAAGAQVEPEKRPPRFPEQW